MKKIMEKSAVYYPPVAEVLAVTAEGILCASQHESYKLYDGNDGFAWEE